MRQQQRDRPERHLLAASPPSVSLPRTIAVSAAISLIAGSASALCAGRRSIRGGGGGGARRA